MLITWFPAGETKHSFSLEMIIKGKDLGTIMEPNNYGGILFNTPDSLMM